MAVVQISDVIVPAVYGSYGEVNSPELTAFLASGVVAQAPMLQTYAEGASKTGTLPYWTDLDQSSEQEYSNDDPADKSTPQKIGMSQMAYRISYMNKSWSSMDLVNELIAANPMAQIRKRTSTYWLRRLQKRIIAISRGVMAKNIATNSGDMVIDISTQDGVNATDANRISASAFVRAMYTMGDAAGGFAAMAVHSIVKAQLTQKDEITFVRSSDQTLLGEYYKGLYLITDDSLPVIAGTTSGFRYVSILYGRGVIGMGVGSPPNPVAVDRDESAGNGGGQETLWERKTWLLHPMGHNWVEGSLAEFSPTDADLALAAHWARVYSRKQVQMAFLITNG